jgi:Asp/Glu/hydantoin racemase
MQILLINPDTENRMNAQLEIYMDLMENARQAICAFQRHSRKAKYHFHPTPNRTQKQQPSIHP